MVCGEAGRQVFDLKSVQAVIGRRAHMFVLVTFVTGRYFKEFYLTTLLVLLILWNVLRASDILVYTV